MICEKCGRPLAEGEICVCGQTEQPQPQMVSPAIGMIRTILSSKLFLALAILLSVLLVFQVLGVAVPSSGQSDASALTEVMDEYGLDYSADDLAAIDTYMSYMSFDFSWIFTLLTTGLFCAGFWLLYIKGKEQSGNSVDPQGLSFIKAAAIIELVANGLAIVLAVAGGFFLSAWLSPLANELGGEYAAELVSIINGVVISIVIMIILFVILNIVFYAKALQTIGVVKNTMQTGQPVNRISKFVIVMCYIIGVIYALSALGSMTDIISFAQEGCSAAIYLILGILLNNYKKQMTVAAYQNVGPRVTYQATSYQTPQQTWQAPTEPLTVTYVTCAQCGQQYPKSADACPKCGSSITQET